MNGFNSSHAYSTAGDSLYGAWQKAHYPMEYYLSMLEHYDLKKNKNKISLIKDEMGKYANIKILDFEFSQNNYEYNIDKEKNSIIPKLTDIKFLNQECALGLYNASKKTNSFLDFILNRFDKKYIDNRQLDILIKLNYFKRFGKIKKLLNFIEWVEIFSKKTFDKNKISYETKKYLTKGEYYEDIILEKKVLNELVTKNMEVIKESRKYSTVKVKERVRILPLCRETDGKYLDVNKEIILQNIWNDLKDEDISDIDKIKYDYEYLGYIRNIPVNMVVASVSMVSTKNSSCNLTSLRTKASRWYKFDKREVELPNRDDVIIIEQQYKKKGYKGREDFYCQKYIKL